MWKPLPFVDTALASLPLDTPEARRFRTHPLETLRERVHPRFCSLRERCLAWVIDIIRESARDEVWERRCHRHTVEPVEHPTSRTEGEPHALPPDSLTGDEVLCIPLRRRGTSERQLEESAALCKLQAWTVTGVITIEAAMGERNPRGSQAGAVTKKKGEGGIATCL